MSVAAGPPRGSIAHRWGPTVVVVALLALLVPTIAIPVARGELSGLFAPSLALAVPFALVGAFLLARGATTVIAVLVSAIGVLGAGVTLCAVLLTVAEANGSVHAATVLRVVANLVSIPTLTLLAPLFLVLPDGRLAGRRWRWLLVADAALAVAFLVLAGVDPGRSDLVSTDATVLFSASPHPLSQRVAAAGFWALLATVVVSVGALVARRRRSAGVERAQLMCLLYGGALNAVLLAATVPTPGTGWGFAAQLVTGAPLPIAIGIAVRRYRLYEIDRVVSRTVTYAVVVVVLAGVYVGVLAGFTALLPAGIGQVGVAAATLSAATLAVPLTGRVRARVDRRFDRTRFDAERVVALFAARVRARPDSADVSSDLLDVVGRTVSPRVAGVWVLPPR